MLNDITIMGRLTRDVELRYTKSETPVASFTLAVDRNFSNEKQTDFIDCVAWRSTAEFISKYFSKGRMIIVEGSLRNADYTDANGVKHYAMEVQADRATFGESKSASQNNASGNFQQPSYQQSAPAAARPAADESVQIGDLGDFEEILSDGDVPF